MKNIITIFCALLLSVSLIAQNRAYKPELNSPADESTDMMIVTLLDWNPIAGYLNIHYELQIADNINFNNPVDIESVASAAYTPTLKFNTTYYWRVRAIDDDPATPVSDWSDVWSFTTFATVMLSSPQNNFNAAQSPRPILKWRTINTNENFRGIEKFEIKYSTNEDMSDAVIKFVDYSNKNNTSITAQDTLFNLTFGQIYYWDVRAYNDAEGDFESVSDWTNSPYKFIVINEPTLNKPTLKKNVDVDPDVTLELKSEYIPVKYEFQIAYDSLFTSTSLVVDELSSSKSYTAPVLEFGETYYWRARHSYENAVSDWSYTDNQVWWFQVISQPELKAPKNGVAVGANGALTWTKISTCDVYYVAISTSSDFPNVDTLTRIYEYNPITTNIQSFSLAKASSIVNAAGTYYWKVMGSHKNFKGETENTEWSETRNFVYNPTGIKDYNPLKLSVYPNPSHGNITIDVDNNVQSALVTIYDMVGKIRFSEYIDFNGSSREISVALDNGLYILEVNNNGVKSNKKITIQ